MVHQTLLGLRSEVCAKDDQTWFQAHFAERTAELLVQAAEAGELAASLQALREELVEKVEPVDCRTILPLLDVFLAEVMP
jgi:hypothetical protein